MLPHKFCPGCGHVPIAKVVEKELIARSGILVGSVGCSVALSDLFERVDAISSAHGRALSVATALRMCLPDTPLVAYAGDGDCCTIGAGELIHTILRNPRFVCVLINNHQFGMTGHQMSALSPLDLKTKTSVKGRQESIHGIPLNVELLMKQNPKTKYYLTNAATKVGIDKFEKQLKEALNHDGFSLIEVISPCPTFWGNVKKSYKYAVDYFEKMVKQ